MNLRRIIGRLASPMLLALLAACGGGGGGGTSAFTIGGNVTGLASGTQLVLNNNGGSALTISANGAYTFAQTVDANGSYAVTVATQPTGQTCAVANANGSGVVANVTNANVTCSAITYAVGGTVSGLAAGDEVVLSNNGGAVTVTADGSFSIADSAPYNGTYNVTVATQPVGKTCTVANGAGAGVVANVTTVAVSCSANTYAVGGSVSGLASGEQVTLMNGAETLTVNADGVFSFATPVAYNGGYGVTVNQQPVGQTCSVANGAGTGVTADVNNIAVTCSTNTFTIGGTVTGLAAGEQVTLLNNGTVSDSKTVSADGSFAFDAPVTFNGGYSVTVGTQPTGQTCTVANGAGAGVNANVSSIAVTCADNTFTIGGTVSGLTSGQLTLINNGDVAHPTTVTADGAFTFSVPVAYNGGYSVTVGSQPVGQTCSVLQGAGAGVTADVTTVAVNCSVNTFSVGGTVAGLASGQQVTLISNGDTTHPQTLSADGAFNFTVPYNGSYAVTVSAQPTGQTCTVANANGAGVTSNVNNIAVTCSTNTYTIGGTISGLTGQVTLVNNGDVAHALNVPADGSFTFSVPVSYGGGYAVTVGTQPVGQVCTVVANGSGSSVTANVTNVSVTCSVATFTVSGTVTGLSLRSNQQVTLNNNGSNPTTVNADGSFSFSVPVAYASSYAVTVGTYPDAEHCAIVNGTGSNVQANVANVQVNCRPEVAYVVNDNGGIAQYAVNAGGSLTPLEDSGGTPYGLVATGTNPRSIAIDPTGNYAYVPNFGSGTVSQYTIGADGSLTANGSVSTGTGAGSAPYGIAIVGTRVYVANGGDNSVSQFTIGTGGALTPLVDGSNAPYGAVTTDGQPLLITADPTGRFVYVANYGDGTLSQFSIASDGHLVPIAPSVAIAGTSPHPYGITIDPAGRYAYVSNYQDPSQGGIDPNAVLQYSINQTTGELTLVATTTTGVNGPYPLAIDPAGQFAFWSNSLDGTLAKCTIGSADGALSCVSNGTAAGSQPRGIAIDPSRRWTYVVNHGDSSLSQFTIGGIGGGTPPTLTGIAAAVTDNISQPYYVTVGTIR